jgi:hypothetical protein
MGWVDSFPSGLGWRWPCRPIALTRLSRQDPTTAFRTEKDTPRVILFCHPVTNIPTTPPYRHLGRRALCLRLRHDRLTRTRHGSSPISRQRTEHDAGYRSS